MVNRLGAAVLACLSALSLAACGTTSSDGRSDPSAVRTTPGAPTTSASAATTGPTSEPTAETAPPGLDEVPAGYDESPDGEPARPDGDLSDGELTGLLRTRASAHPGNACAPKDVEVSLVGFDVALGHRFTSITVRNVSARPCVLEGTPGIGVRGTWGTRFVPEVGAGTTTDVARPVELAPAASATSLLEWTGALAGAESEHASLVVVQLARGQVPVSAPAHVAGDVAEQPFDIGLFTTLRLTPFVPKG